MYGNHCDGRHLADLGITNLHVATASAAGITVTGLQSCVRHKSRCRDLLYTQAQYADFKFTGFRQLMAW